MDEKNKNETTTFALNTPFVFEGQTYTEFPFDLDKLTGEDMLSCERQLDTLTDRFVLSRPLSMVFQLTVASRAAQVPPDVLRKMPAKDFSRMMQRVQNFLLG